MLKTIMLSATALLLLSAAPVASAPAQAIAQSKVAAADDTELCLLHAGCFHNGVRWICSNPQIYMDCLNPADPIVP